MGVQSFAIVSAGTIGNIILLDPTADTVSLPASSKMTSALDGLSPYPQIGWPAVEIAGTWSYAPPTSPTPTIAQQATAMLNAGVQIISTAHAAALNGTYACDTVTQQKIAAISLYCLVNGNFPGGGTTYPWPDISGTFHTFPSVAEFQAFASAVANYVAALDFVIAGMSSTLPTNFVTIA
jgi:hypothetical protein